MVDCKLLAKRMIAYPVDFFQRKEFIRQLKQREDFGLTSNVRDGSLLLPTDKIGHREIEIEIEIDEYLESSKVEHRCTKKLRLVRENDSVQYLMYLVLASEGSS